MKQHVLNSLCTLGAALLLCVGAQAATPDQFASAHQKFLQATSGQEAAIEPATQAFVALLKAEPGDPVVMAYAGAATSMQARTTWLPWKKMRYAEDGLAMLDKALMLLSAAHNAANNAVLQRNVPAALETRFVAANTFLAVPEFMNRKARGTKLLQEVANSPLLANAAADFRKQVADVCVRESCKP